MILVNILGSKISFLFSPNIRVSVGILLMPFLCLLCDMSQECFGKKWTNRMVNISIAMLIFMILIQTLCVLMPPHSSYKFNEEYTKIFGMSIRMALASFTSFFIAQKIDVILFFIFKLKTKGKYLFIRNIFSTIISQFFDTCIFMFIAFFKLTDKHTTAYVFSLILPYWGLKCIFAFLYAPFCYLGRKIIGEK